MLSTFILGVALHMIIYQGSPGKGPCKPGLDWQYTVYFQAVAVLGDPSTNAQGDITDSGDVNLCTNKYP